MILAFYFRCQIGYGVRYPSKNRDGCSSQGRSGRSILAEASLCQGKTVVCVQWCLFLPAPGECFLITIANFGDTVAFMQPGTTVGVDTNIEQVLLLDDDVDEKRDWRKEVPMNEVPESIREQALAMLSEHASMWDGRPRLD
jgi:hypothetical protein